MFRSVAKEEIQVPAHIDYLGELRNFVTKAGRKHGFSDSIVNAFKLSIDEAATNIIKHAYRDWEGMIKMRVIVKKNSLTVLLIDQGKFFDPSRVQDPDLERYVQIGKKGGLGIFIMRKLIDEIEYRHTEEGNELRLTKYRDVEKKRKVIPYPSLSFSMKTKYSIIAASIMTSVVLIGYMYFFFQRGNKIFKEFVQNEQPICARLARDVFSAEDIKSRDGVNVYQLNAARILEKVEEAKKGRDEIYRIIVTDVNGFVEYCDDSVLEQKPFFVPNNHKILDSNVVSYKNENGKTIYNFSRSVVFNEIKVGTVYLEIKKDYLNHQITLARLKDLQLIALILAFGFLGIIVLIYIILNPFRKLATWVKDLGSGDVKDEIDFDTNDEVGEIAKAFSEITDKFRDSQKNLAEQERIQKEMQLAQDIQQALLPTERPELEEYEIASYYEAAKEVGGDYYDFIEVDKDTLGIVVADVSGKGVPGSLIMTMIRTALRTEARAIKSASEVLTRVNDFVVNDMKKGMFVTLFYIIIDSKKRRINYASAGHNPMVLYRHGTRKTYYLNPRGFPVGISLPDPTLFKQSIESDTIQLAEDDILIIYTDGITEAMNNRRELFSEERLQKAIRDYGNLRAHEFVENLKDEIHSFTEGFEQSDDITLVAIKEKSSQEKIELRRAQKAHKMIAEGSNIREACEQCGVTVYAYYNKYKKIFEEEGIDAFEIDDTISVEAKHLSIEEKTKIYDIIKQHPEYGAKRISEELNTERYGFAEINENRIYDELVRSRLNTRQLREAYIARAGKKRRMKPPGTPMLTLDGKIILDKRAEQFRQVQPEEPKAEKESPVMEKMEPNDLFEEESEEIASFEQDDNLCLESLMSVPIEDLLKKRRGKRKSEKDADRIEENIPSAASGATEKEDIDTTVENLINEPPLQAKEKPDPDFEDRAAELLEESQEFSFRAVWNEAENETKIELKIAETEKENAKNSEAEEIVTDSANEEQANIEAITAPGINIDDILSEDSTEAESSEFELLAEDISFKEELLAENKSELVDFASQKSELSEVELAAVLQEDEIIKSNQALADQEFSDIDFTFNDLLEEIEKDIALYDEQKTGLNSDNAHQRAKSQSSDEKDHKRMASANESDIGLPINGAATKEQMQNKHLLLGLKYYRQGKYEKAVEQINNVIKKYPDFKEAYSFLGNAYYHANRIDEAMQVYQRVKKIDPRDTDSYENIGIIYANQGKLEKAIEEWKMVMMIDPKRKDVFEHIEEAEQLLKKK